MMTEHSITLHYITLPSKERGETPTVGREGERVESATLGSQSAGQETRLACVYLHGFSCYHQKGTNKHKSQEQSWDSNT